MKNTTVSALSRLTMVAALVVMGVVVVDVEGYGSGAPMQACERARPMHTSDTTNMSYNPLPAADNPYRFTVNKDKYKPGRSVKVTIEGTATDQVHGFFLQARAVSNNMSVGGFDGTSLPAKSQLRPCATENDAVTHMDKTAKTGLTFTWTAPNRNDTGDIRFVGAVALNHDDFYVGIESAVLTIDTSAANAVRVSFSAIIAGLVVAAISLVTRVG